jgi:hypothetical protein
MFQGKIKEPAWDWVLGTGCWVLGTVLWGLGLQTSNKSLSIDQFHPIRRSCHIARSLHALHYFQLHCEVLDKWMSIPIFVKVGALVKAAIHVQFNGSILLKKLPLSKK